MLDFTELPDDGHDFELLIRELLFARGFRVNWAGRGADAGRDLLCVETGDPMFGTKERLWLVQCKHFAHSNRAVGVSDLEPISDVCAQHGADAYLLACSTYPSSSVVSRLEALERESRGFATSYLDASQIERLLSTPNAWQIAQRFFLLSAGADWRVWATEHPNRWIVAYRGFRLHLINRIGSTVDFHLDSLGARLSDIAEITAGLPKNHEIRPRGVYFNDKAGAYVWYLDYLVPRGDEPELSPDDIRERLGHDYALEDGQSYAFDVLVKETLPYSDHYDRDHYDYYLPHLRAMQWGGERAWNSQPF